MLPVIEAQSIVLSQASPLPMEVTALTTTALGQVLAADIASDMDSPPFTKAMMDGFAVHSGPELSLSSTLTIVEEIQAGAVPQKSIGVGETARIMTGAPRPQGADAVVQIERVEVIDSQTIRLQELPRPGQHILNQGSEMRVGQIVLPKGTMLKPQDFGILGSVGKTTMPAFPMPQVAIMATGDELVEPMRRPKPGQIRNTNGPMLVAQTVRAGAIPRYLGIAKDNVEHLRSLIGEGLETTQVTILSGGVSAGKFDLVPQVLQELGVQSHFHKVEMKPGKPVFFGTRGKKLVFGLPGNPVSSYVCFELFVRPALRQLRGEKEVLPRQIRIPLTIPFQNSNDRPTYFPARIEVHEDGWKIEPLKWFGSADLCSISSANALIVLPAGKVDYPAGEKVRAIPLEM